MSSETKRRLVTFLNRAEPLTDLIALVLLVGFFISYLPKDVLNTNPATGGDMGSHFWPLVTLTRWGLPEFTVRIWNPGNLGGEPHLVHYFPFPFLLMAAMSWIIPLGQAFNIGTLIPLMIHPLCVYAAVRLMGLRFPQPILAAAFSLLFLYNEGYSMWGGNTLSTLAGQFAHGYGICFLLLGTGVLCYELRHKRFPLFSAIIFTLLAISHAYVLLGLPLFALAIIVYYPVTNFSRRLLVTAVSGVFAALCAAWFLVPMIDNSPWTTPYSLKWILQDPWNELVPRMFYPALPFLLAGPFFLVASRYTGHRRQLDKAVWLIWFLPALGYAGYFFLFPKLGLVDTRAIPQIQLFFTMLGGISLGIILRKLGRSVSWVAVLPIIFGVLWWIGSNTTKFTPWLKWNYSGWETKALYPDLQGLTAELIKDHPHADFSAPRVVFEHNEQNNGAGTTRVFEMLPYFAGRATLESVYMQATILAPMTFRVQAEVSKTPSCPFPNYECSQFNIQGAESRLRLLGVGDLILITPPVLAQANASGYLTPRGKFGIWQHYQLKRSPELVGVFPAPPKIISNANWKREFWDWFTKYQEGERFLVTDYRGEESLRLTPDAVWAPDSTQTNGKASGECHPELKVDFNRITLRTDCPGRAHYLKFAYHSSWRSNHGERLFLVSPGFIGIIPQDAETVLKFGERGIWVVGDWISISACVLMLVLGIKYWGRPWQPFV